jgi:hypothetical protein
MLFLNGYKKSRGNLAGKGQVGKHQAVCLNDANPAKTLSIGNVPAIGLDLLREAIGFPL